ncbi:MAG: hypothetical protein EOP62_22170 [Sphingomonadales bacterium]|nr:MAG: hypothetical protein EOP62_22170 [Sphingomonadales bacterium]
MNDPLSSPSPGAARLVVIGGNSVLWSRIADRILAQRPDSLAIGHRDIDGLRLSAGDRIWIFSYAPDEDANRWLFDRVKALGAGRHVYLSSATANIADEIHCYRYPRVKAVGERDAARILDATPVRIGLIHDDPAELPAGTSAATRLDDLVAAMLAPDDLPDRAGGAVPLYRLVERPFASALEHAAYRSYDTLLRLCGRHPCLLRPIDLLLRSVGWRWYGYFRLSNTRCLTTT